jgi:hypothetical protein
MVKQVASLPLEFAHLRPISVQDMDEPKWFCNMGIDIPEKQPTVRLTRGGGLHSGHRAIRHEVGQLQTSRRLLAENIQVSGPVDPVIAALLCSRRENRQTMHSVQACNVHR